MSLELGNDAENKNFKVDIEKLVDTRLLVQANSGGGKSWALRRLLEQSHGIVQQIVLDLEGEFATLREKFDYVLVGKEGDIKTDIKSAELLAKRLLELGVSAIIDLYELKHHERITFVKRFLDSMINAPKELWHPCIVVVDEAHVFCPEKGQSEAMGSVIDLCTRGRKRGYCAWLATQRLSKLHKDAAAECNNKLIGRTGLDIDMKRASEELGFTSKQQMLELRELNAGEFFAFGPAMSKTITKVTIGNVATTHPKAGSRNTVLKASPPTSKVLSILSKLNDLPKEAEEELRTVQDFKSQIRSLKAQLSHTPKLVVNTDLVKKLNDTVRMVADENRTIKKQMAEARVVAERMLNVYRQSFERITKNILAEVKRLPNMPELPKLPDTPIAPRTLTKQLSPLDERFKPVKTSLEYSSASSITGGCKRMLNAMALFYPEPVSKQKIATLAGLSPNTGTFTTYLSTLLSVGYSQKKGKDYVCTDSGKENASDEELPSGQDLIDFWISKFSGGCSRMLKVITERYPDAVSKEELGELAGIVTSSGTFTTYLSTLKSNGLIIVNSEGIVACEELMK